MATDELIHRDDNIYGDVIGRQSQSALYLFKIKDKLSSTHNGYTDHAPVLKWNFAMEYFQQGSISSQTHVRRPTTATPLEVYLHHGHYIPSLLTMVAKQEIITGDDTSLKLLMSAGDVDQVVMTLTLTDTALQTVDLSTDLYPYFRVVMRYSQVKVEYNQYNQNDFTKAGTNAFTYDFKTNVLT